MRLLNRVELRVFAKLEEDSDKIKQSLLSLVPFDINEEKIVLERSLAVGFNKRQIAIFRLALEKERHIRAFAENFIERLGKENRKILLRQSEGRLDERLHFFIRLDKKALLENRLELTDSGDCFHIRMSVASFPKKRETALAVLEKIFKE